jgi:hypothetical protein
MGCVVRDDVQAALQACIESKSSVVATQMASKSGPEVQQERNCRSVAYTRKQGGREREAERERGRERDRERERERERIYCIDDLAPNFKK